MQVLYAYMHKISWFFLFINKAFYMNSYLCRKTTVWHWSLTLYLNVATLTHVSTPACELQHSVHRLFVSSSPLGLLTLVPGTSAGSSALLMPGHHYVGRVSRALVLLKQAHRQRLSLVLTCSASLSFLFLRFCPGCTHSFFSMAGSSHSALPPVLLKYALKCECKSSGRNVLNRSLLPASPSVFFPFRFL